MNKEIQQLLQENYLSVPLYLEERMEDFKTWLEKRKSVAETEKKQADLDEAKAKVAQLEVELASTEPTELIK